MVELDPVIEDDAELQKYSKVTTGYTLKMKPNATQFPLLKTSTVLQDLIKYSILF